MLVERGRGALLLLPDYAWVQMTIGDTGERGIEYDTVSCGRMQMQEACPAACAQQAQHSSSALPASSWPHLASGLQPSTSLARYTMPHRETVAGDATARSCTSNSMRMVAGLSLMRSPLGRHSVQLSSSTAGRDNICVNVW
jgi:hypothetical protein